MTDRYETYETLREARRLIEEGWVQHHLHVIGHRGQHLYCAIGALNAAARSAKAEDRAGELVAKALGVSGADVIALVNDGDAMTKERMLEAFDEAVRLASPDAIDRLSLAPYPPGFTERVQREKRERIEAQTVRAEDVMTDDEKAEMDTATLRAQVAIQRERLDRLADRVTGVESSLAATAKNLRDRLRRVERVDEEVEV